MPGTRENRRPSVSSRRAGTSSTGPANGPAGTVRAEQPYRQCVRTARHSHQRGRSGRQPALSLRYSARAAGAHADTPSGSLTSGTHRPPSNFTKGKHRPSPSDRRSRESIPTFPSDTDKRRNGTHWPRLYRRTPNAVGLSARSDAGSQAPRPHRGQAQPHRGRPGPAQTRGPRNPTETDRAIRPAAAEGRTAAPTRSAPSRPPPAARPASPGAAARAGSRGQTKGRRTDRWQNGGDTRARGAGTARLSPPQPPSPPPGAAHLRAMDARQVPAGRAPLRSPRLGCPSPPGLASLQGQKPMSRRSERHGPRFELTRLPRGEALHSGGSQPASIREREGPGEPRAARSGARPRRPGAEGSAAARAAPTAARGAPPGPISVARLSRAFPSHALSQTPHEYSRRARCLSA